LGFYITIALRIFIGCLHQSLHVNARSMCSELSSGMYCRVKLLSTDLMEAVRTSETSVNNNFTRQYIPEANSELPGITRIH
jgi:hypothetical protein